MLRSHNSPYKGQNNASYLTVLSDAAATPEMMLHLLPQAFCFILPLHFWKSVHNLAHNRVFPRKVYYWPLTTRIGVTCGGWRGSRGAVSTRDARTRPAAALCGATGGSGISASQWAEWGDSLRCRVTRASRRITGVTMRQRVTSVSHEKCRHSR